MMNDSNLVTNSTEGANDLSFEESFNQQFDNVKQWIFTNFFVILLSVVFVFIIIMITIIFRGLIRKAKKTEQPKRRKPTLSVASGSTLHTLTSSVNSIMSSNNPYDAATAVAAAAAPAEKNVEKSSGSAISRKRSDKSDDMTLDTFSIVEHTIVGGELCEKRTRNKRIKAKTNEIDPKWVSNEPKADVDDRG